MAETVTETQAADVLTKGPAPFSLGAPESPSPEKAEPTPSLPETLAGRFDFYKQELQKIIGDLGAKTAVSDAQTAEAEKQYGRTVETVVKPAMARVKAQTEVPPPAIPKQLPVPPQPDISARPFGATEKNTLGSVVQTLGLMAQMAMGAGKAPKAALGAFTGAMTGWAEGDSIRAERDWKKYLEQVDTIRQENRQALGFWEAASRQHGQNEQAATAALSVALAEAGFAKDAITVAEKGRTRALQDFATQSKMIDGLFHSSLELMKIQVQSDAAKATQAWHQEQIAVRWEDLKRREQADRERAEDRRLSLEDRQAARLAMAGHRNLMDQLVLQAPQSSFFWDKEQGEVRAPNRGELIQNQGNFHKLPSQEVSLVHRLAVAGPVLDALDKLIDRINVVAPGQNITQGLINQLKRRAGIGEDIQAFQTLKLDSALENAAALSGGQPRISILYMLRGEAQPNEFMTHSTAKITNDLTRTTIQNRLGKMTGDPDAFKKLQVGQEQYRLFEAPAKAPASSGGLPSGWKIEPDKPTSAAPAPSTQGWKIKRVP